MRTSPRARRTLVRACAPLVAATLLLTACGGEESPSGDPEGPANAAPAEPDTWPLTGLELPEGESPSRTHPPYIAKIDNTASSAPQVGLGKADLVVEELVEGGITRLAAFFYSELPAEVGPIRSMRATDVDIAAPAGATIVASGAAAYTKQQLDAAKVSYLEEGADGFSRDSGRPSLYSVMADLAAIGEAADQEEERPADYLPWGEDLPQGQPATSLDVRLSTARTSRWVFEGGTYRLENAGGSNSGNYMAQGDQFRPETVIVARVRTSLAPYKDPSGAVVPVSHFEGKGQAMIFHGGQLVRGTWQKRGVDAPVTFSTKAGELQIPPGKVWIELIPGKGAVPPGDVTFK